MFEFSVRFSLRYFISFYFVLSHLPDMERKTPTHLRLERLRSEAAWLGTYLLAGTGLQLLT